MAAENNQLRKIKTYRGKGRKQSEKKEEKEEKKWKKGVGGGGGEENNYSPNSGWGVPFKLSLSSLIHLNVHI